MILILSKKLNFHLIHKFLLLFLIILSHKTKSSFVLIDANLISSLIKFFLIITVDVPISQDFNKSFNSKKFLAILFPIIFLFSSII